MTPQLFTHSFPEGQLRLLILCVLLLGATVVTQDDRATAGRTEVLASVFAEPPAYLHPPAAIGFDLSGLKAPASGGVEAALVASARDVSDVEARAHTHMSLAVYYKIHGDQSKAAAEKRKGDYWLRVAKIVEEFTDAN